MSKIKNCPNCGKKGFYETDKVFLEDRTHRCKYCEMEFKLVERRGEMAWEGDIPVFS
jgi:hypothetical protein